MKRLALGFAFVCAAMVANAQDLVITNARILDVGTDIARGSIVIEGGRIVSVAAGSVRSSGKPRLDAGGRTVPPGYIDAHRHIISGDAEQWFREQSVPRMQEFFDAGISILRNGWIPACAGKTEVPIMTLPPLRYLRRCAHKVLCHIDTA